MAQRTFLLVSHRGMATIEIAADWSHDHAAGMFHFSAIGINHTTGEQTQPVDWSLPDKAIDALVSFDDVDDVEHKIGQLSSALQVVAGMPGALAEIHAQSMVERSHPSVFAQRVQQWREQQSGQADKGLPS